MDLEVIPFPGHQRAVYPAFSFPSKLELEIPLLKHGSQHTRNLA